MLIAGKEDYMFRKKLVAFMMITVLAVSFTACGDKAANTVGNQETSVASNEGTKQQQTTKSAEQEASEKASAEELSKKAEEIKSSMAAAVEKAANETNSKAQAEAESKAAAQAEAQSQQAALQAAAAQVANQLVGSSDEVVTVVDSYGVDSARMQYLANYDVYVELVRLTNELRASLGVAPLTMEENICIASCKKAVDYYLADYYDGPNHTMIDGRRWQALFEDFNIAASARAENLAKGSAYKTAQQMFDGWKNSEIHYNNMVNPAYTRVGVGSCGYVWFMDLAG